jgi:two-component sensor histidine kinase
VSRYPLGQALPAEVLVRADSAWSRYRRYPVFSAPWLRGRSLLFAAVIAVVASVVGFGVGAAARDFGLGLLAGAHLFAAFLLMATTGPALATLVRHRRWPLRRERIAVVVAVLLGMVASLFADMWASNAVEQRVEVGLVAQGVATNKKPDVDPAMRPLALAINVAVLVVVYGMFGGGLSLRAYFSEGRRWSDNQGQAELQALRAQKQQADLRLGLLQAQVEPHFLFNTLASVRALVRQDPARAEATLDALVEHLRATLPRLRDGEAMLHSTLGQQLDICASYLELMRLRMGGRLAYAVEAAPELRQRAFPPLLLITLVENAIKHGIEPQPGPGRIEVRAAVQDGQLVLGVVDDGAGLQPGMGGGVGLANVREQLATRYGDRAKLELRSEGGRGAVAEIRIPLEPAA